MNQTASLPTVPCRNCESQLPVFMVAAAQQAIRVLIRREGEVDRVSKPDWRKGPMCDKCLARWSASLAETGR